MIHCPYLDAGNRCRVATQLADGDVRASTAACQACQANDNPQAINVVTIGMALVQRKRFGKPTDQLKKLLDNYKPDTQQPVSLRIGDYRPGPGSELKKMLAWFARPSDACQCESRADTMNDWGAEGCRQNLETIIDWLLEEAQIRGLPHGKFTRVVARSLVHTAIGRFERKYPDGPPEPTDEEAR